jgi:FkbM family methyltransferase
LGSVNGRQSRLAPYLTAIGHRVRGESDLVGLSALFGLARSLAIYRARPWKDRALRQFLAGFVRPGDLVFDIGAHVGNRSIAMVRLGARVVAVEPQRLYADFLERTMSGRLVAIERCALGAEPGQTILHVSSRHPTVSTVSADFIDGASHAPGFQRVRWDERQLVETRTLDMLIARHGMPAFCKIDVEGAEATILAGLSQPIRMIAFEYIPPMRAVALDAIDRLASLAPYRFNRVVGESNIWVNADWCDAATMRDEISALPDTAASGDIYAAMPS